MDKINFSKEDIKKKFIDLVTEYGEKGVLYTFNYCSDYGVELENSTIDQIEFDGFDVLFTYNMNEDDEWDYIEKFSMDGLICFYNDLVDAIESEMEDNKSVVMEQVMVEDAEIIMAGDLFKKIYKEENNGLDYTLNLIKSWAREFAYKLNWKGHDDERDLMKELEQFEAKKYADYKVNTLKCVK